MKLFFLLLCAAALAGCDADGSAGGEALVRFYNASGQTYDGAGIRIGGAVLLDTDKLAAGEYFPKEGYFTIPAGMHTVETRDAATGGYNPGGHPSRFSAGSRYRITLTYDGNPSNWSYVYAQE